MAKQHIWPKWLKKINQPHVTSHVQVKVDATYLDSVPRSTLESHQGHSGSRTARKVCKKCNNGWIERLEERIREPVTQFIEGGPATIDADTQLALASWIALVTMMLEFTDLRTVAIPPTDYVSLFESGKPPAQWKVWIAKYIGSTPGDHVVRHYGLQLSDFPDVRSGVHKCDTQVTTFVIGTLCAHSFCSAVLTPDEYVLEALPPIWPPTGASIDWSTARGLADRGIVSLSSALLRMIPRASAE